ncbi:EAL domain-containing protein [Sulfurimonas sp. SAG-AH-194-I05]|nr:EAL domain-containing protein [Sulfurimonas sp. SAG-AH-194-I05]MDF1874528.1 EAL domain-containing protein [Sulfurimonas sp. SAG-AH-194-I05]
MKDLTEILMFTKTMTLLYVEDNESVRKSTIEIFKDMFGTLIIAFDGEDGLEKFYSQDIDIIISDINMPTLNGLEMSEKIREFDRDIPILLSSAHNESHYFTKAIELNINGYMLKPLRINELIKSLQKILIQLKHQREFNNNLIFLEQYQTLIDTNNAVSKTNLEGILTYANDAFCKLSGYTRSELIGKNHNVVRHPDNDASMYTDLWYKIKVLKESWQGVIKNISKDSKTYYVDMIITPIFDKDNTIVEYISIKRDVTEIMSPLQQLRDYIESASNPLMLLIKVDGFTDIESFYGYKLSKSIDDTIAESLYEHMPRSLNFDKFLSLGNGEYVFIQNFSAEDSLICIEDLTDDLKSYQRDMNTIKIDIGDIDYDITIIISMADGKDCLENVKHGMKSLELSKQDFLYANNLAQEEQNKSENNLVILKMVKKAIDTGNIISYFQPIVCNETQEILKYESLVRLVDTNKQIISPFFFLDIAKKGKYYAQITAIVLENSFKALSQTDKSITINISALDIEKLTTREKIYELLELHKDETHRIVFELLEDEDVHDFDTIITFITRSKSYGVRIAIDDFGAGYSNFERLLKYQPDILKIDGSLIKNIETDTYSLSVVKSIVAFAKEQKIEMVAEYIENENIFKILKKLGVEYSQGYYFGKPDLMR